jgi:RNase P subunit RPR2
MHLNFTMSNVIYKSVNCYSIWIMGRRKTTSRPHKTRRTVEGRCPKCTTIVRFNVSGSVGNEIYECMGCRSKFHIDEL